MSEIVSSTESLMPRRTPHDPTFIGWLLDSVRDVIWCMEIGADPSQSQLTYLNDQSQTVLGYSPAEFLASPALWWQNVAPDDHPQLTADLQQLVSRGGSLTRYYRFRHKTSRDYRWLEDHVAARTDAHNRVTHLFGIARDVTDRKRSEELLRRSDERYRAFLHHSAEGIWCTELTKPCDTTLPVDDQVRWIYDHGRLTECNDAMAQMYGFERADDLLGQRLADFLPKLDARNVEFLRVFIQNQYRLDEAESHEVDRHGRPRVFLNSFFGIVESGYLLRGWGVQRDITDKFVAEAERRRLEEQLQKSQKLESLGMMAGGIAHDFNNLLMSILGHIDLALFQTPNDSPARPHLQQAVAGVQRAAELTQQLLATAGKSRTVLTPVELNRLLSDTLQLLAVRVPPTITVDWHLAPNLLPITADASQLRQVVMNLFLNAVEAIGEQPGVISVMTLMSGPPEPPRAGEVRQSHAHTDESILLVISDTGSGMTPEVMNRIFEPFYSTKFTGRGLGLATVLGIVRKHHATIGVSSEPGRGTTFRIWFSRSTVPVPKLLPADTRPAMGKVLIIDDDEPIRRLTSRMLEKLGYTPLMAANGPQGLERLREQPDIQIVLIDLTMPGWDGVQTLHELRQIDPNVRAIFSSGYSEAEVQGRVATARATGYLSKPYRLESLRVAIQSALAKS